MMVVSTWHETLALLPKQKGTSDSPAPPSLSGTFCFAQPLPPSVFSPPHPPLSQHGFPPRTYEHRRPKLCRPRAQQRQPRRSLSICAPTSCPSSAAFNVLIVSISFSMNATNVSMSRSAYVSLLARDDCRAAALASPKAMSMATGNMICSNNTIR